jgi:hypothetical protein
MVPRHHDHPNASLLAPFDHGSHVGPWGIEKPHESQKSQLFVRWGIGIPYRLSGKGKDSKALLGQRVAALDPVLALVVVERLAASFGPYGSA